MLGFEHKALLMLIAANFLLHNCSGETIVKQQNDSDEADERMLMPKYGLARHLHGQGLMPGGGPTVEGLMGTAHVNPLLGAYLNSADARRIRFDIRRSGTGTYLPMLVDALLEERRPFHPRTDAEAIQMLRDFIASRDVTSDFAQLKPEHANHGDWRERLKHLLIHYCKQPFVRQHPELHAVMKWYLKRLKHTIWVRRRLLSKRIAILKMNLLFTYLQSLDYALDQREYRFDIYKDVDRTTAFKRRLEELCALPEVKMNPELSAAFTYYIGKLNEALEEIERHQPPPPQVSDIPAFQAHQPEIVPNYADIVQEFIDRKKTLANTEEILDGHSLETVGGIQTFLEHYLTTDEVQGNETLTDAINTFVDNLKKLPSHHLLDTHLKRETFQKIVTKYEVVHEYLSKLEWKRSGTPEEVLIQALQKPDVQSNSILLDAIRYYLEHSPKEIDLEEDEVDERSFKGAQKQAKKDIEEKETEDATKQVESASEKGAHKDAGKDIQEEIGKEIEESTKEEGESSLIGVQTEVEKDIEEKIWEELEKSGKELAEKELEKGTEESVAEAEEEKEIEEAEKEARKRREVLQELP